MVENANEQDFHDLFAYNFTSSDTDSLPSTSPRPPLNTNEAIRLISMEIRPTRTEAPGPGDGQELPVVFFEGTAKSMHAQWEPHANSRIKGSVRLTKEGEVRWQSVSVYGGEERWASEGIQIGGLRSARGVLGHWFDKYVYPFGTEFFWIAVGADKSKGITISMAQQAQRLSGKSTIISMVWRITIVKKRKTTTGRRIRRRFWRLLLVLWAFRRIWGRGYEQEECKACKWDNKVAAGDVICL